MVPRHRTPWLKFTLIVLCGVGAAVFRTLAQEIRQQTAGGSTPILLARFFLDPGKGQAQGAPGEEGVSTGATNAPPSVAAPPTTEVETSAPPAEVLGELPQNLAAPKPPKYEVAASGDFLYGQGWVTLPIGFSLQKSLGGLASFPLSVASPTRQSYYYGGTLSFSSGQAWYFDLSIAQGHSSGNQDLNGGPYGPAPTTFTIDDTWYQGYVRYTFPGLRGKRLSSYVRAGISFVHSDMTDNSSFPSIGLYEQTDTVNDILGQAGFGVGYSIYNGRRARFGLQLEGEGFFGHRNQESLEKLQAIEGIPFKTATINNNLYGGIGQATAHFEYRLGQSGLFKIFADGGLAVHYTRIDYTKENLGTPSELLWGPYAKAGIRYSF